MTLTRLHPKLPPLDEFVKQQNAAGVSTHIAIARYTEHKNVEVWADKIFIVTVYRNYVGEMNQGDARTMLAIRRADGQAFGDWSLIQEIKNQLLGDEAELVQLFPAESRKIDAANMYWFYDNVGQRFPFGAG